MIQIDILSGSKAGSQMVVRRFPFRIGRSPDSELRLEDAGVWDGHLEFSVRTEEGVMLGASHEAMTFLNGEPVQEAILRNGDLIDAGSVKMRFGLSATQQSSLRIRETLTWVALAGLCLAQIGLIYWLAS